MAEDFIFLDEPEDDAAVPSGFDDAGLPPEDDTKADTKDPGDGETPKDPQADDQSPDPDTDQAGRTGHALDPNIMVGIIAKQTEQINQLMTLAQNQGTHTAQADPGPEHPGERPKFTQEQWDNDPDGCTDAILDHRDRLNAYNQETQQAEAQRQEQEQTTTLQRSHADAWSLSTDIIPELKDNPQAREAWSRIFYDPQAGFSNDPMGPLKATKALKETMQQNGWSFTAKQDEPAGQQASAATEDPAEAARRGAEDEAGRQSRLKRQTMHIGGKGGGQQTIQLSKDHLTACENLGIKPEVYAKTLQALRGGK